MYLAKTNNRNKITNAKETFECLESTDTLLKIWTRFNDENMTEQAKNAEELRKIKDVKIDSKKVSILVDSWGIDKIEAMTMLRVEIMKNRIWNSYLCNWKTGPKKVLYDDSRKNQG